MSASSKLHSLSIEEKRALLAELLRQKATAGLVQHPLSFTQQRLWFLSELAPGNPFYNVPVAVELSGKLKVMALERSLNEIVRRHEALRTVFPTIDGRPVQVILPTLTIDLPLLDLQHISASERRNEIHRVAGNEARTCFDLERGPLVRTRLVRLDATEHVLLVTVHHIVADGWSMGVFVREIATLYECFSANRPSVLDELPIQYRDYVAWQQKFLTEKSLETQIAYWKRQLYDLPVLNLPTDRQRPPINTFRGATEYFQWPKPLTEKLKALSRDTGATLFMILLAAFETVLHRYTGQEEIVVGSPVNNRTHREIEGLIGFFVNALVLRTDVSGNPTFRELLSRTRDVTLAAFAHQDLPFEQLVEELQPERDLSRHPLFQVMLVLQNAPMPHVELDGVTMSTLDVDTGTSKFDLTVFLWDNAEGLKGSVEYSADLFEASTIRRMLGHLKQVLEIIAIDPDHRIKNVPLLTEDERYQLLHEWSGDVGAAPTSPISELFAQQVERTPDAIAVAFENRELTYRQLDQMAEAIAASLVERGVGPEVVVGICAERSIELIAGLIGILKAGGAYLALDPTYPTERTRFMVEDSKVRVILTQEHLADRLPKACAEFVSLAVAAVYDGRLYSNGQRNPGGHRPPLPDNIAYVTYTSGSTGTPKGACITHRNVARLVTNPNYADLNTGETFLQFAPVTFDASTFEIWGCLLNGGRLVIHPPGTPTLEDFGQFLVQHKITTLWLTAGLFHQLVDTQPETLAYLHQLLAGGDALSASHVVKAIEHIKAGRVINGYGPTETTTFACCHSISSSTYFEQSVPIGRPITRTTVFLLDDMLEPVPRGIAGELFIGGEGLARCYLNQPDLTAAKFIPNPFSKSGGERLYRTGDVVRYLPDGTIDFLGRIDDQVKVRGYRIEPGEIESVLNQHPDVRESAVIVREELRDDKRLIAYVATDSTTPSFTSELWRYLRERLPDHLVPSAIVPLGTFPLTANGKVDRRALPSPNSVRQEPLANYVAPRTAVEKELATLWAQVLGVEKVGIHDNFFELGGHSLLATQLMTRIRSAFHVRLPLSALFATPTVAALALIIAEGKGTQSDNGSFSVHARIKAAPEDRHNPFPLTDVQQAFWLGRTVAFELGNVSTQFYVELEAPALDLPPLQLAFQQLIARHEMLRAIVLPDGRQQILATVPPYEIATLSLKGQPREAVKQQLHAVRERMTSQVFPSDRWPLFEIVASVLDDDRIRLHIMIDALIADAWSGQILDRELYELYMHPDRDLENLSLSFRDYVLAEESLQDETLFLRSQEYWRRRIPTLPPPPELPLAQHPSSISQPHFVARSGRLDAMRWLRLKNRASQAGLTPSGVLLAAYAEVLGTWSKSPQFTLNLSVSNRLPLHPQVNDVVGNFSSLILLAVDHSARGDHFEDRARRLQEQLWEDLEHRYVSGVQVLRELVRAEGGSPRATMPIVFTSTLTQGGNDQSHFSKLVKVVHSVSRAPQVWLEQHVLEEDGALVFRWDMVDALFPDGLPDDMFNAYARLLRRLAEEDQAWHENVRHLVPATQLEQRAAINATEAPIPTALLHELFEAEVPLRPKQRAVAASGRGLTYQELDDAANEIAHELRSNGVQANTLVAVVMEKGWEQIVAVLGILKAGAAYLPIEASVPPERLKYLLQHGQVSVAITQAWLDEKVDWPDGVNHFAVAAVYDRRGGADPANKTGGHRPPLQQLVSNLAYVIFTSGSTGLPKGVMIDHRGAVNTVLDINQRFNVAAEDRVLALSSLGFDLSVYDIFGTLAAGATIVMPPADALRDPSQWADLIAREQVTIWNSAPALMTMLAEYMKDRATRFESLRLVLLSGDWIPVGLPDQIRAFAPNARVISLGGATEASIWSILYPIEKTDSEWKSIPYGMPMLNQRMHVFNDAMEPCPVWVPGQLYIGGIGLALGYWRDEQKTNASFVVHPTTGERLYRTGDLGRYLSDGNIEFLGREDSQVKIRGYRIELGEIETTLCQHPTVGAAVVRPEGEERANRRLIAYVIPDGNGTPNGVELREFLEAKLPEYMVPSAFVVLKELPVNINGKVDTKRLPSPDSVQIDSATNYIAPRTNTERAIASVWQEVLSLARVSMDHSFFELGGDSAMMIRVQNKLTGALQKEIPIAALFTHTTVPDLAAFLDQRQEGTTVFQRIDKRAARQQEAMRRQKQRFQERNKTDE